MVVFLAEIGVPGICVGVELYEGQRTVNCGGGPEFGQRYGVIPAEDYRDDPRPVYLFEAFGYLLVALVYKAWHYRYVAVVYNRKVLENRRHRTKDCRSQ